MAMIPTNRATRSRKAWAASVALTGALALSGGAHAAPLTPHLSFPCGPLPPPAARPLVTCQLAGQGFARHEAVAITYRVEVQWMQGAHNQNRRQVTTYRRRASTDGQGAFQRPAFGFAVPVGDDVRVWKIWVQVRIVGAHGDRAAIDVGGGAD